MKATGFRNAAIAVACYYIGRAGGQKLTDAVIVAKRTAASEEWSAPDSIWSAALDIVSSRPTFSGASDDEL